MVAERDQGVLEEEIEATTEEHDALAMMEERAEIRKRREGSPARRVWGSSG